MQSQDLGQDSFKTIVDGIETVLGGKERGKDIKAYVVPNVILINQLKQINENYTIFQRLDEFASKVKSNTQSLRFDQISEVVSKACPKADNLLKSSKCLSPQDVALIHDEIRLTKASMANRIVVTGAVCAAGIIIIQAFAIKSAWNIVREAQNVIENSKDQMALIASNVTLIDDGITKFENLKDKYEKENVTAREKRRLETIIRLKTSKLSLLLQDTRLMICELKIDINGKKEAISVSQKQQVTNGLMNAVHCITNVVQSMVIGGTVGSGLTFLQGLVVASFASLVVGNVMVYRVSEKELVTLRKIMNETVDFEIHMKSLMVVIDDTEGWILTNVAIEEE